MSPVTLGTETNLEVPETVDRGGGDDAAQFLALAAKGTQPDRLSPKIAFFEYSLLVTSWEPFIPAFQGVVHSVPVPILLPPFPEFDGLASFSHWHL